jgi:MATE family multidrug resistance protein
MKQNGQEALSLFRKAFPIFLFNLVNFSFTIVDSLMVSRLGEASLGAVGQAGIYFNVIMMFFLGILSMYTPFMSRLDFTEDKQTVKSRMVLTLLLCFVFSILLVVILSFTSHLFLLLNQPGEIVVLVNDYISILMWSTIFILAYNVFVQTTYILEKTKIILYTVIGGNILNVFLNWVFIYGNLGFPRYELTGSAIATLIVRVVMVSVILYFIIKQLPFNFFKTKMGRFDLDYVSNLFKKGIPKGIVYVNDWFASFLLVIFIGWGGVSNIASNQVGDLISSLMYMLPQAFCVVITIRLSKLLGQKLVENGQDFKKNIIKLFKLIIPMNVVFLICIFMLLPLLIKPFSLVPGTDAYNLAYQILIVHLCFFLFYSLQYLFIAILDSMLDTNFPSLIAVGVSYVFVIPIAFLIAVNGGSPIYIWIIDGIGNVLMSIFLFLRVSTLLRKDLYEKETDTAAV